MSVRDPNVEYCEGTVFAPLNSKIRELLLDGTDFIVFLDDKLEVQHYVWDDYDWGENNTAYSEIISRYSAIEAFVTTNLSAAENKTLRPVIQRLLGESVARMLDDRATANANILIDNAQALLAQRKKSILLSSALTTLGILLVVSLGYWHFRYIALERWFNGFMINDDIFQVTFCALFGGLGGFLSFYQRLNSSDFTIYLTRRQCIQEALMRSVYGVVCAFFFALAIKTDFILGIFNGIKHESFFLAMICTAAGFSEKIISNLIQRIENSITGAPTAGDKPAPTNNPPTNNPTTIIPPKKDEPVVNKPVVEQPAPESETEEEVPANVTDEEAALDTPAHTDEEAPPVPPKV